MVTIWLIVHRKDNHCVASIVAVIKKYSKKESNFWLSSLPVRYLCAINDEQMSYMTSERLIRWNHEIRAAFPILNEKVKNQPLIYLDNAATTQKPQVVIDALATYYRTMNANIHRGIHSLAEKATEAYESTRTAIADFIHANSRNEVVFTRGTTESINLIANSLGKFYFKKGDEILISTMEHHSNIVPWQMVAMETGAVLRVMPINEEGEIVIDQALAMINERTKMLACVYVSNSLGTVNPVRRLINRVHEVGGLAMIDAAQAVSHFPINVQELGCDFLVFSSHKLFGPTGIGIMWGRESLLEQMPPYQGGGEMIKDVTFEETTYNDLPYKFEAGTPNIADTVAFKSALEYFLGLDYSLVQAQEHALLSKATQQLQEIDGLRIIGQANEKVDIVSFVIEGVHHQDIGVLMDNYGIALRTGHHCTQPLMKRLGLSGTCRASFAIYNTLDEVDQTTEALKKVVKMLR